MSPLPTHRLRRESTIAAIVAIAALALGAGSAGGDAAGGGWWIPPQRLTWYWQLQGAVKNTKSVAAYDIDGFENGAGEVSALHAQGKHVICYIDVGTSESGDFQPFLAAGKPVLNAEYQLSTSRFCAADNAVGIMGARYGVSLNGAIFKPCW